MVGNYSGIHVCLATHSLTLESQSIAFSRTSLTETEYNVIQRFNPLIPTLKPHSNGPLYSNTMIGTLAVDGWAVTFVNPLMGTGNYSAHRII